MLFQISVFRDYNLRPERLFSLEEVGARVALLGVGPVPSRPSFLRSLFGGTASLLLSLSAAAATKRSDNRRSCCHKEEKKEAVKPAGGSRGFIRR